MALAVVDDDRAFEHAGQGSEHGGQAAIACGVPLQRFLQFAGAVGHLRVAVEQQALDRSFDLGQNGAIGQRHQREIVIAGHLVGARAERALNAQRTRFRLGQPLDDRF